MVGLDPTIHIAGNAWILGSSPRMTKEGDNVAGNTKAAHGAAFSFWQ
jgi:hypothetical protein